MFVIYTECYKVVPYCVQTSVHMCKKDELFCGRMHTNYSFAWDSIQIENVKYLCECHTMAVFLGSFYDCSLLL